MDGLSFLRKRFVDERQLRPAEAGKSYWIAEVTASELRHLGLSVVPDDPSAEGAIRGHCVVPEIRLETRSGVKEKEQMVALAARLCRFRGPFVS